MCVFCILQTAASCSVRVSPDEFTTRTEELRISGKNRSTGVADSCLDFSAAASVAFHPLKSSKD